LENKKGIMKNQSIKEKSCAGIVTYNPEIKRFKSVLSAIVLQVDKVFIDDNGSKNIIEIKLLLNEYSNVSIHEEGKNTGIAHALNQLCLVAIDNRYEWLLTLDHDTISSSNMVDSFGKLIEELKKTGEANSIGIICPRVHYRGLKIKERGMVSERSSEVFACMTSGSFMNLEAFKKTQGFDEWMFIDYVDNDICMKLKILGYKIFRDNKVFMDHQLGNVIHRRIGLIKLNDFQYSPLRIYYITRNSRYFRRKYKKELNKFWKLNNIKYCIIIAQESLRNLLLYHGDKERIKALKDGIIDGNKIKVSNINK
jgi:rhamnosyltransferase